MPRPALKPKMKKKKKSKVSNNRSSEHAQPLSRDDVVDHVAALYMEGYAKSVSTTTSSRSFLKELERHPALLLNADYQPLSYLPLSMWNWQESVKGIFTGKVQVVEVYPDVSVRGANWEIKLPSVIALTEYVSTVKHTPAFTKRNVFLRDEYRCQYCAQHFRQADLSLDHVVPRCRGGTLEWDNVVASCRRCNGKKGSLCVSQLKSVGMELLQEPFVPSQYQLAKVAGRMLPKRMHPTWEPYIQHLRGDECDEH
jgi:5-methylcytosine-specific restriction endonuclease McrA